MTRIFIDYSNLMGAIITPHLTNTYWCWDACGSRKTANRHASKCALLIFEHQAKKNEIAEEMENIRNKMRSLE